MSGTITFTVLAGLTLASCLTSRGCHREPDHRWHDAEGHVIAENWKTDADGKRVPDPHPYDPYGRQWVYDANGVLMPLPPPAGTTYHSTHHWWWGGTGYRTFSSGTSYRSGPASSSPSVSHGGFGSTGHAISSGS